MVDDNLDDDVDAKRVLLSTDDYLDCFGDSEFIGKEIIFENERTSYGLLISSIEAQPTTKFRRHSSDMRQKFEFCLPACQ